MVRVWDPQLTPWLDDNRILAAHAEIHYILGALERGRGMWWKHPETQRFYNREDELRWLHDVVVAENLKRGHKHNTPLDGPRMEVGASEVDCFGEPVPWLQRDMADLFRKWTKEDRWRGVDGLFVHTGRKTKNGLLEPRMGEEQQARIPDRIVFANVANKYPPREWTKADRERLRPIVEAREVTP